MKKHNYFFLISVVSCAFFSCNPDDELESISGEITSFSLSIQQDGRKNAIDIKGDFNEDSTIITLQAVDNNWIYNPESLIASFTAKGIVKINGVEQISDVSAVDFRKEQIYTVDYGNLERKYIVKLISPQSTGLPVIKIDTEGGAPIIEKENYLPAVLKICDVEHPEYEMEVPTGIRGRGNSTWWLDKKPYRIKLDKKASLFGLGAAKSWVLLANYMDPTFIMNTVTFELGRRLNIPFTNHANHVELFLNNKYGGSYVLTEQVEVNKDRIDIDEKTAFLVELDQNYDEEYQFRTNRLQLPVMVKSPELNSEPEMQPIQNTMQQLEDALFDPAGGFPNNNYKDLIDIHSVIDYLIVNEIVRNGELHHPKSVYMYKEQNQTIKAGPLWDFDWAFGYTGNGNDTQYNHKYYDYYNSILFKKNDSNSKYLFNQFFKDPDFRNEYKKRWNEVQPLISDINQYILELAKKLKKSQIENEEVWKIRLDYDSEINKMINWLNKRIVFLNEEINRF
jgi:hypothetical protein